MLLELNVKDIALVRKASVSFDRGLNILTGETGTGKSVIIDSAMLALGAKARSDVIRRGAEYAYAELVFGIEGELRGKLESIGIFPDENGLLVISRKILPGRSISRVNDETVTLSRLREIAGLLLDVYGQNEYYTLKDREKHLSILDEYMGAGTAGLKQSTAEAYTFYRKAAEKARGFSMDEQERARRIDLLNFEWNEINEADLKDGEEEELSQRFRKLNHARAILEYLNGAHQALEGCDTGRAVSELERAMHFDEGLAQIHAELLDAQSILDSVLSGISAYADELEVDDGVLAEIEERLDLIRRLELKYGQTIPDVLRYRDETASKLQEMQEYEEHKRLAEKELADAEGRLSELCAKLSRARREGAERLCAAVMDELRDLGFEKPQITMRFEKKAPSADGYDTAEFYAALNPGEDLKPLSEVASGGELSRMMLAVKTILAETDEMPTLIFDEIDTGISGRTAQKVAEKLDVIGMKHQVICVSHLPQIAAMSDVHFVIRKTEKDGRNVTEIERLDEAGSCAELARLLGGAQITKAVAENAAELRELAKAGKRKRRKT